MKQHSDNQPNNRQHSLAVNTTRRCLTVAGLAAIAGVPVWQSPARAQTNQTPAIRWKTDSLTINSGRIIGVHNTVVLSAFRPDLVTSTVVVTGIAAPIELGRVSGRDNNIEHLPAARPNIDYTLTRTETADGTPMVVIDLNRINFRPTDRSGSFELGIFDTTDHNAWVPVTTGGRDTLRVEYANAVPRVTFSRTGVVFQGGIESGIETTRELDEGIVTVTVRGGDSNMQLARVVKGDNNIDQALDVQPRIHYGINHDTYTPERITVFTLHRVVFRPTAAAGGFTLGVFNTDTRPEWTPITNGPSFGQDTFRVTFRGASEWVACNPANPLSDVEQADFLRAASSGNIKVVRRYLSPCVRDINATDNQGHTALILAAANNHARVVELLIAAGADLEIKDTVHHATALLHAVNRGDSHIASVRVLLDADADVNTQGTETNTPLIVAARNGATALVKAMLATGRANIDHIWNQRRRFVVDGLLYEETIRRGDTALLAATKNGHSGIVEVLLHAGADVNIVSNGDTALLAAVKNGHNGIIEILLRAGADANIVSNDGPVGEDRGRFSPLIWAAYYNNYAAIDLLRLSGNANLEYKDHVKGQTAFLWAAERGHTISLKYLRTLGACLHARNNQNKNAYQIASSSGTKFYLFGVGVDLFKAGSC